MTLSICAAKAARTSPFVAATRFRFTSAPAPLTCERWNGDCAPTAMSFATICCSASSAPRTPSPSSPTAAPSSRARRTSPSPAASTRDSSAPDLSTIPKRKSPSSSPGLWFLHAKRAAAWTASPQNWFQRNWLYTSWWNCTSCGFTNVPSNRGQRSADACFRSA